MRLLDLFCGAGGAAMGYHRAGFDEIVGIDIEDQPRYPFSFIKADALHLPVDFWEFDLIHASPPCQFHSSLGKGNHKDREYPELIIPTRKLLDEIDIPYVIENVSGARSYLDNPVMLCGTMFGLQTASGSQLRRHRYFEISFWFGLTMSCSHNKYPANGIKQTSEGRKIPATIGVYGGSGGYSKRDNLVGFNIKDRRDAMGIQWMTGNELSEAIPPAYTEWIGKHFLAKISGD